MMMNDLNTLRETNPELLKAINMLKRTGFLYSRENTAEYDLLCREKSTVDYWLSVDNAEMVVVSEYGMVYIRLASDEDSGFQNNLRGRLTLNEMKVYLALNQLYDNGYVQQGAFVEVTQAEILNTLQAIGFSFDGNAGKGTKTVLIPFIRRMKQYGFLREVSGQLVIPPAIKFGLSPAEFGRICGSVLNTWLEEQNRAVEGSKEAAEGEDNTEAEAVQEAFEGTENAFEDAPVFEGGIESDE